MPLTSKVLARFALPPLLQSDACNEAGGAEQFSTARRSWLEEHQQLDWTASPAVGRLLDAVARVLDEDGTPTLSALLLDTFAAVKPFLGKWSRKLSYGWRVRARLPAALQESVPDDHLGDLGRFCRTLSA